MIFFAVVGLALLYSALVTLRMWRVWRKQAYGP